jgi:CheY-like chemotaxis protein
VARILVADDNSNIQKMVSLALKDQGIDVIAVGNGEAAVRKISDIKPDLVLADVFMPVRNGYEVCKYVKDDSSLAHIPVILLVGAFDPLDEQEAQRVGADGVLKKPFVPPDPLISMVKSALIRAANAATAGHALAGTEKVAVPSVVGGGATSVGTAMAGGLATAGGPSATIVSAPTVYAIPKEEEAAIENTFVEEIPAKPETLKIESAGKPLAFGSLMETPAETADDAAYVAPPNPELADRDWNAGEVAEEEEEEEDSASSSWRRDGGSDDLAAEPSAEKAAEKAAARNKRRESWTPTREKSQNLLEDAVAPESLPMIPPPTPKFPEPAPAQNSYAIPKVPAPVAVESKTVVETEAVSKPEIASPVVASVPEPIVASVPEPITAEVAKSNGANSWFSTSSSPWEAEAQKVTQLASTWDAPPVPAESVVIEPLLEQPQLVEEAQPEVAKTEETVSYDFVSEAPSEEPVTYVPDPALVSNQIVEHDPLPDLISDGSISPETVESIRQETTYALESVVEPVQDKGDKPAGTATKTVESSQQDMDALVANVLAKMSPEMLQAVTREILKPVVAAMIRDEINAKKS